MTGRLARALLLGATGVWRAVASTWTIVVRMPDGSRIAPEDFPFERELFAIRERDLLAVVPIARLTRAITLVADGKDGDRASVVAERIGVATVRGSSIHDSAAAALRFCRALREWPGPGLLAVDGPLGPSGVAKRGIAALAGGSGMPIRAVAVDAKPKVTLGYLWSGMIVPLPFARIAIAVDDRIAVESSRRDSVDRATSLVTERLEACARLAADALEPRGVEASARRQVAR